MFTQRFISNNETQVHTHRNLLTIPARFLNRSATTEARDRSVANAAPCPQSPTRRRYEKEQKQLPPRRNSVPNEAPPSHLTTMTVLITVNFECLHRCYTGLFLKFNTNTYIYPVQYRITVCITMEIKCRHICYIGLFHNSY